MEVQLKAAIADEIVPRLGLPTQVLLQFPYPGFVQKSVQVIIDQVLQRIRYWFGLGHSISLSERERVG
jgi:hypothetical protein